MKLPSNHEDFRAEVIEKLKTLVLDVIPADQPLAGQLLKMNKGDLIFSQLSKPIPALSNRAWEQIRKGLSDWKEDNFDGISTREMVSLWRLWRNVTFSLLKMPCHN